MKLGLQIYSSSWPGGPEAIGPTLARAVRTADEVGFDSLWVMDHCWQIGAQGSELPQLRPIEAVDPRLATSAA
jgi:alkanesulfonate monooxygenase SsuD/methylene tetrahydromethanopterin reductase-like flavin-dependent oxidoreductase (luciferase family)